jgi:hypothetical protein
MRAGRTSLPQRAGVRISGYIGFGLFYGCTFFIICYSSLYNVDDRTVGPDPTDDLQQSRSPSSMFRRTMAKTLWQDAHTTQSSTHVFSLFFFLT